MRLTARRSGGLVELAADETIRGQLAPLLTYKRRYVYEGNELRIRKMENPDLSEAQLRQEVVETPLWHEKDGKIIYPVGLHNRVVLYLMEQSHDVVLEDLRPPREEMQVEALARLGDIKFRFGQADAFAAIGSHHNGIIKCPTGWGKTFVISHLPVLYPRSRHCIAVRGVDLVDSVRRRVQDVIAPEVVGQQGGGRQSNGERVVVCSADSVGNIDLGEFDFVWYDECHEAATEKRTRDLWSRYTNASMFGFSASPFSRPDMANDLVEALFGPVICDIEYASAADEGVVVPVQYKIYTVPENNDTNWSSVDYLQDHAKKRTCYWNHESRHRVIAQAVADAPGLIGRDDPQILILVDTIDFAYSLRRHLPGFELVYGGAGLDENRRQRLIRNGLMDEDEQFNNPKSKADALKRFEKGKLRRVIATSVWRQGVDAPGLDVFIRADGTVSNVQNIQQPGRLSRLSEGKQRGLLIDFMDDFCEWARRRSIRRIKAYKDNGFTRYE